MADEATLFLGFYTLVVVALALYALSSRLFTPHPATRAESRQRMPERRDVPMSERHYPVQRVRRIRFNRAPHRRGRCPPRYDARTATITLSMSWWHTTPPRVRWAVLCYTLAQHTSERTQRAVPVVAARLVRVPQLGTHLAKHGMLSSQDGAWINQLQPGKRPLCSSPRLPALSGD
jgi:hypothetical protein